MAVMNMPFHVLNAQQVLFAVNQAAEYHSEQNANSTRVDKFPGLGSKPYYLVLANPTKSHILNPTNHSVL